MPKFLTSFNCLNITQFLTALNDNLYKLLLVFFLISIKGAEHSNTILAVAGAVFVIPFLLFASLSGSLADRFSKRSIIYFTRLTEILTISLSIAAFFFQSIFGLYAVLFLMALQSTLFSPCKYGIIPEIVPPNKISHCNGVLAATTYLAIIIGTFLASFLTQIFHNHFVKAAFVSVIIAVLGFLSSTGIEKTRPQSARKKISTHFIKDIYVTLKRSQRQRYLPTTLIFGAFFLFMGAYTQLNIIPFTLQSLKLSEVQGGYLFLMTAIGIGIGSYLAGQLSGKEVELGFVPLATLGISISYVALYLFSSSFFVVVPFLILMGICGGFFIVPVDAFIQIASPSSDRGENVAAANFLSFLGVIVASGLLAFLGNTLHLSAAQGFLVVGILTFFLALLLFLLYADQVMRLVVSKSMRHFLNVRASGKGELMHKGAALLIAPRSCWLDTLIVMATLPRRIRYIVPLASGRKKTSLFYRLMRLIPIDLEHFTSHTLPAVKKELALGNAVCLMHPIDLPAQSLKQWEEQLKCILQEYAVPCLPIHISSHEIAKQKGILAQLRYLKHHPVQVSYTATLPIKNS